MEQNKGGILILELIKQISHAAAIPVFLMVLCNVIDYITGIIAAKARGRSVSSYEGINGIAKKVCMWFLVVIGGILDILLSQISGHYDGYVISAVVAIWIICNEIISILENMVDIGVDMPPFLLPIVERIKKGVEEKNDSNE